MKKQRIILDALSIPILVFVIGFLARQHRILVLTWIPYSSGLQIYVDIAHVVIVVVGIVLFFKFWYPKCSIQGLVIAAILMDIVAVVWFYLGQHIGEYSMETLSRSVAFREIVNGVYYPLALIPMPLAITLLLQKIIPFIAPWIFVLLKGLQKKR